MHTQLYYKKHMARHVLLDTFACHFHQLKAKYIYFNVRHKVFPSSVEIKVLNF